jgi:hypothetical protein
VHYDASHRVNSLCRHACVYRKFDST